jgi:formamidopyrimidine-DNA glycosylase
MHLRMTGTLLLNPPEQPPYARVRITLGGDTLWFSDPRRFGTGQLFLGSEEVASFLATRLGVEPFAKEFTGPLLRALSKARRGPIKPFLLDQRNIAGIGNIYADEALFRARIHPRRAAGSLTPGQYELLAVAIRDALTAGIDAHGASIDDFRDLDGARGTFQDRFLVHRREGEPCPVCGAPIEKLVVGGRGTYVCRHCQPVPRRRAR